MNSKKELALKYIELLENGKTTELVKLFAKDGMVESPIYGVKKAADFYKILETDTTASELNLMGIFKEKLTNRIALYFNYKWTLRDGRNVEFDVVDIMELDSQNKINKLKIIYDTIHSRELVGQLK